MDPQAQQEINRELSTGEQLVWAGRPQRGIKFRAIDAFLIPFGIIWCGFIGAAFVASSHDDKAPLPFKVVPLLMLMFGLFVLFGRPVVEAYQRQRTFYGVTNERLIIVYGIVARRVKSLLIKTLNDVSLTERSSGAGTITFGPNQLWNLYMWPFSGAQEARPAFEYLEDARSVYALIRNTHAKAV